MPGIDDETRVRWLCAILEYVRREGRWGMKDVDMVRQLCGPKSDNAAWWADNEPALRRWYGDPPTIFGGTVS